MTKSAFYTKIGVMWGALLLCSALSAQNGNHLFNDTILHRIDIKIDLENWFDTLSQDYRNNDQNDEMYRKCNATVDGIAIEGIGMRQKGNFSNAAVGKGKKKPFKLNFGEFSEQTFDGVKKVDLKNMVNDPSLLHEILSLRLFRSQGIAAPRAAYATLYVNDTYWGLYLMVESVDKTFLKHSFGGGSNNDGNLYRPIRGARDASLKYLSDDVADYKAAGLTLVTNEDEDDWSRLLYFIDLINNEPPETLPTKLDSIFDVETFLKIMATEKLLRAWDNYSTGGANYYIYEHPDGKIRWVPWDYNETFQRFRNFDLLGWFDGYLIPGESIQERQPLLKAVFQHDPWRQRYFDITCELLQNLWNMEALGQKIPTWRNLVTEPYREDPHKLNSFEDFQKSLYEQHNDRLSAGAWSFKFRYAGIVDFFQFQRRWATDQLDGWGVACAVDTFSRFYPLEIFPNPAHHQLNIKEVNPETNYSALWVYNVLGQLVWYDSGAARDATFSIQLDLPKGYYTLQKWDLDGRVGVARFVVQ